MPILAMANSFYTVFVLRTLAPTELKLIFLMVPKPEAIR